MPLAFHNGAFVDAADISISPSDYGFARGMALFEFLRVYGGVPFRLHDHLQRFDAGRQAMGLPNPYSLAEMEQSIRHLCAHNKFPHSGIRIYLTLGRCGKPGTIGICDAENFAPNLMIMEDEAHPQHPDAPKGLALYQTGIAVKTMSFAREMPNIKSTNYLRGFLAIRELAAQGWHDILYTNPDGYVTEATTGNFFCVIDNVLTTPARGMLHGITRKVVLELAPQCGITVAERDIAAPELAQASATFLTGSYVEMMPIRQIDDRHLPATFDAPLFTQLRRAFTNYIAKHCQK